MRAMIRVMGVMAIVIVALAAGYVAGQRAGVDDWQGRAVDTLVVERARMDTAYQYDTIRLWRAKRVYDTVRVADTVMRNDTVFIPRAIADSVVDACHVTVSACERRLAIGDSIATFWKDSVRRIPPRPSVTRIAGVTAIIMLVIQALAR